MKKGEFYINTPRLPEYPKVNGYIEVLKDKNGYEVTVGYDKRKNKDWTATELTTGFSVAGGRYGEGKTKKACAEEAKKRIAEEDMEKMLEDAVQHNVHIKKFVDFLASCEQ